MYNMIMSKAIILAVILVMITGVLLFVQRIRLDRKVFASSTVLKELDKLNNATRAKLSPSYFQTLQIDIRCKSKTDFDTTSLRHCLSRYMATHYKAYASLYAQVISDCDIFQQYLKEYEVLRTRLGRSSAAQNGIDKGRYDHRERRLFEIRRLSSPQFRLDVRKTYTSPKRRNNYCDQGYFFTQTFIDVFEALYHHDQKKKAVNRERRAMTNELRYQILQRDGFRCQVCGRTQADGTVLHIDHIMPVSKGGKTEPSNLRVLCAECNLGKGSKYDPVGIN